MDSESELDTEEEAEREAELEKLKNAAKASMKKTAEERKEDGAATDAAEKNDVAKKAQNATLTTTPVIKVRRRRARAFYDVSRFFFSPQKIQMPPLDKSSRIAKRTDKFNNTEKEHAVEKILAKRFNPRRKLHEYLLKWEGLPQ